MLASPNYFKSILGSKPNSSACRWNGDIGAETGCKPGPIPSHTHTNIHTVHYAQRYTHEGMHMKHNLCKRKAQIEAAI